MQFEIIGTKIIAYLENGKSISKKATIENLLQYSILKKLEEINCITEEIEAQISGGVKR